MYQTVLLHIVLLLWAAAANATPLSLDADTAWPVPLNGLVPIVEDPTGRMSMPEIASYFAAESGRPAAPVAGDLRPGFTKSAVWLELELRNDSAHSLPLRFAIGPHTIGRVDYYLERNGLWTHRLMGESIPLGRADRLSSLPVLGFTLSPGEQVRILARAQSDKSLRLRPALYSAHSYDDALQKRVLWDHIYFGAMGSLAWCILAIFMFARKISLLVMGSLCAGVLLYEFINRGYAKIYWWPQASEWAIQSANVVGHLVIALYILTFHFLSKQEKIHLPARQYLLGIAGLQVATALATFLGDYQTIAQLSPFVNLLTSVSMVTVAVVMMKKAVPTAGLMLLTNVFLMFRLTLTAVDRLGLNFNLPAGISVAALIASPAFMLTGLLINLSLIAAWVNYVGKQRRTARNTLATWQEQEQHRLETEVAKQTRALTQALQYTNENNRKQTETLSYISHDLRVPLATIIGYTQLLSESQTRAQKPHVEAIERSARYQLSLISELLEATRNELQPLDVHPSSVALNALMDDIKHSAVALSAQQGNEFHYEAKTPLPEMVMLDGRRLQQVLLNLLANAAKFTRHGTISMTVSATRNIDGWRLYFIVADTGIGMEAEIQTEVFKAFTQLHPRQGGVGLGLFIARQIIETMGGQIKVESAPGMGSRFSFEIEVTPAVASDAVHGVAAIDTASMDNSVAMRPCIAARNPPLPDTALPSAYRAPPAHTRVELAIHARDGQLTDIEAWLDRMLEDYPAFTDYFNEVQAALDTLDFEYIEALALSSDA